MTYAVEVQNLSKSIDGCPILKNICMRVKQGEIYGFLGANGAGKTSLMKTLYHIIRPDCGTVCLLGECVAGGNSPVFPVLGALSKALFFITICRLMTIWNCIADIWVQDMKISGKPCHCWGFQKQSIKP